MKPILAACLLLSLAACARPSAEGNAADLYNVGVESLHPSARAVTIGDNGAQAPACAARGRVVNLSAGGEAVLPVRAAPFADADQVATLGPDAPLFLCSRSIDQRWQGVVIPPDAAADCGVSGPVASPRGYAGPCRSGWVVASFVQVADR